MNSNPLSKEQLVSTSKFLSYVLRHGAAKEKIKLDSNGYAALDDILALDKLKRQKITLEHIQYITENNDKKRFSLKETNGKFFIRANQGHSIKIEELELEKITNPEKYPVVVHGTYMTNWKAISTSGLNRMSRNHIHFAQGEYGSASVISGMRKTCDVLIYIDIKKAISDGIDFYVSENGVILTEGIHGILPPTYFTHVIRLPEKKPFDPQFPHPRNYKD